MESCRQLRSQSFKILDILFFAETVVNRRESMRDGRDEAKATLRTHVVGHGLPLGGAQRDVGVKVAHLSKPGPKQSVLAALSRLRKKVVERARSTPQALKRGHIFNSLVHE